MNLKQYQSLCKSLDQILLDPHVSDEIVAIPWLHVLRPHPEILKRYKSIYTPRLIDFLFSCKSLFSSLRCLFQSLFSDGKFWSSVGIHPSKCDVLFISHLVNDNLLNCNEDFYFGDLPGSLSRAGVTSTTALINYTSLPADQLASASYSSDVSRLILSNVLPFLHELKLLSRLLSSLLSQRSIAPLRPSAVTRRIYSRLSSETLSYSTLSALRIGTQIQNLVSTLKPQSIVVTYEGHSWERIAFASARMVSPSIRCIAYQHAALFKHQHAIQRSLHHRYNPDVILTSGITPYKQLLQSASLKQTQIEVLGSTRSNQSKRTKTPNKNSRIKRTCLVLPEGFTSECLILFAFSLTCAQQLPDVKFIWRLHPSTNFKYLARQSPLFTDLPKNITLSQKSLDHDLLSSDVALYRGSTSVIQAVMAGVSPVYLSMPGEVVISPLHALMDHHLSVMHPYELISLFNKPESIHAYSIESLQEICTNYFTRLEPSILLSLISTP